MKLEFEKFEPREMSVEEAKTAFLSLWDGNYFERKKEKEEKEGLKNELEIDLDWNNNKEKQEFQSEDGKILVSLIKKELDLNDEKVRDFIKDIKDDLVEEKLVVPKKVIKALSSEIVFENVVFGGVDFSELLKEYKIFTTNEYIVPFVNVPFRVNHKTKVMVLGGGIKTFEDLFVFTHELGHIVSDSNLDASMEEQQARAFQEGTPVRYFLRKLVNRIQDGDSSEEDKEQIKNLQSQDGLQSLRWHAGFHINNERNAHAFALNACKKLAEDLEIENKFLIEDVHRALKTYTDSWEELITFVEEYKES